jgi:hypothetical protein
MNLDLIGMTREDDGEVMLTKFCINPELYTAQGRSFAFMVQQLMCRESRAQLGKPSEARKPVQDTKSRRVRFPTAPGAYGDDPVAVIAECCSKLPEYREGDLPLKEIVNRILLAGANAPRSVMEIYQETLDWVGRGDGRVINPGVILRLLDSDEYYGFTRAPGD